VRTDRRRERFLEHPVRAFWTGVTLLGLVAVMAIVIPAGPLSIDRWWAEAMRDSEAPVLKDLALVFNALGSGLGRVPLLVAVGLVLVHTRRWFALVCFALLESLTSLSSALLKATVQRPRPPDGLVHPVGSAFPSGHAAYAAATCVALVLMFTVPGARRRWWWVLAAVGIAGMAWSRTYLQVHWLSDVVGGSALGIGIALLVLGGAQSVQSPDAPRLFRGSLRSRRWRVPRKPRSPANRLVIDTRSTAVPDPGSPGIVRLLDVEPTAEQRRSHASRLLNGQPLATEDREHLD
jgi:membrane-associated phospholipid phosphatase